MVTPNLLIWWIDAQGILHSCAQIATPPNHQNTHTYAQGTIDPATRSGTITHIHTKPATLSTIPRELFDILDSRFPQTRWWIPNPTQQTTTPTKIPITAHS